MTLAESQKPIVGVTMGDSTGIGPEVIVRAWADRGLHELVRPFVIGHPAIMRRAVYLFQRDLHVVEIDSVADLDSLTPARGTMPCLGACSDEVLAAPIGCVDARAGGAAYQAVRRAADLALAGEIDAIVTAPLSKAALHAAGHHYPGHTELLAEICGVSDFGMMLYLSRERGAGSRERGDENGVPSALGVVHVTLHQSLRSVFADLSSDAILAKCRLIDGVIRRLGVDAPRLAVCALNPHAGEDGLFGDEERTIIAPAVEAARRSGINAAGPFPTDTLMGRAAAGEFDAVVAMYHDQGHIAIKLLGMHRAVNITLGLPIVRTSVAHGTAFDRAWQGTARTEGMVAAIETAARLSMNR